MATQGKTTVVSSFLLFLLLASVPSRHAEVGTYTAAVYEHSVISGRANTRAEAMDIISRNLHVFHQQVVKAKSKGADVFVFPEYGLTGSIAKHNPVQRSSLYSYMELIPAPGSADACTLCSSCHSSAGSETVTYISCMAKRYGIYLMVNLIETVSCSNCPYKDGMKIYNTNVVFDRQGCIVAKYHKYHLYNNEARMLDRPPSIEHVYFDTPFGRFGTLICFDSVFEEPGLSLVTKFKVDSILLPTFWTLVRDSTSSFENIPEYSSGWARRFGINVLAANIHSLEDGSYGSAISTPQGIADVYYNESNLGGKLLITTLESYTKAKQTPIISNPPFWSPLYKQTQDEAIIADQNREYHVKHLQGLSGTLEVCHNRLCCTLEFSRQTDEELIVLAAHSQSNSRPNLEVCLLQKCQNATTDSCFVYPIRHSSTVFNCFLLSGIFSSSYAFPTVSTHDVQLRGFDWSFDFSDHFHRITASEITRPLLNAAIYSFYR